VSAIRTRGGSSWRFTSRCKAPDRWSSAVWRREIRNFLRFFLRAIWPRGKLVLPR